MITPISSPTAAQSLVDTGWPEPYGDHLQRAARLAGPRDRWLRRPAVLPAPAVLASLRSWVWADSDETGACSRAQAARIACIHQSIGVACPACAGSGIDPTGTPTPIAAVYQGDEQRRRRPRCRVCAGIGLTADRYGTPATAATR